LSAPIRRAVFLCIFPIGLDWGCVLYLHSWVSVTTHSFEGRWSLRPEGGEPLPWVWLTPFLTPCLYNPHPLLWVSVTTFHATCVYNQASSFAYTLKLRRWRQHNGNLYWALGIIPVPLVL
jgi:hypothetical protein